MLINNSLLFTLQKLLNTDSIISLLDTKDNKINEMGGVSSGADRFGLPKEKSNYSFIF